MSIESLESRHLLAADPIISEFMASNTETLLDGDGDSSDWIEIFNAGDASMDLAGWHLTDDSTDLTKWTFPSTTLDAGAFLVVFAASKGTDVPADPGNIDGSGNRQTNFQLSANGEYLALVQPDGLTIANEFGPNGTNYPPQVPDISYGIEQQQNINNLIETGALGRVLIPGPVLPVGWTGSDPLFDDDPNTTDWEDVTTAIGFDTNDIYDPAIGTDIEGTLLGVTSTALLRTEFNIDDPAVFEQLKLRVAYDDGFIAYLNGQEVASDNAPVSPTGSSTATAEHEALGGGFELDPANVSVLYTFEGDSGITFTDKLTDDGQQDPVVEFNVQQGQFQIDPTAANAAFGNSSLEFPDSPIVGNFFDIPETSSLGSEFTLAAMVNEINDDFSRVFSVYNGGAPANDELILDIDPAQGGGFGFGIRAFVHGVGVVESFSFADANYHQVAMTYDNGQVKLYVDGVQIGTTAIVPGGDVNLFNNLRFGEDYPPTSAINEPLEGHADDVLVLGKALSASDMNDLYQLGAAGNTAIANIISAAPSTKAVLYTFEGDSGTTLTDQLTTDGSQNSSIPPLTNKSTGVDEDMAAAAFGSNSLHLNDAVFPNYNRFEIPNTASLGTQFTLAAMVDLTNQDFQRVFSNYQGTGALGEGRILLDIDPSGNTLTTGLRFINGTQGSIQTVTPPAALSQPGYHHIALTYDDGDVTIYIDGIEVLAGNVGSGSVEMPLNLYFGEDPHDGGGAANEQLVGNFDDILVLTKVALSSDDIGILANNGAELFFSTGGSTPDFIEFDISQHLGSLQTGTNVLAIQGLNINDTDSDFFLLPELIGIESPLNLPPRYFDPATAGTQNEDSFAGFVADTKFSVDRGFFVDSFNVDITADTLGATIIYTTDGSLPSLTNGTVVNAADESSSPVATVSILTTTTLRAIAIKDDFRSSNVDTQSYLFLDDIIEQTGNVSTSPLSSIELSDTKNLGSAFTLAANIDFSDTEFTRLFTSYPGSGSVPDGRLIFDVDRSGNDINGLRVIISGLVSQAITIPAALANPGYHHVAMTYDSGQLAVYLDGVAVPMSTNTLNAGAVVSAENLRFGEDVGGIANEQFHGNVDEILVLGRALSAGDVSLIATSGIAGNITTNPGELAVFYDFESDSGSSITDQFTTDGAQDGIIHGGVIVDENAANARFGNRSAMIDDPTSSGPEGFPTTWGAVPADYGMDPTVVNSPTYSGQIIDSLKAIPTVSLVLDVDDIFGPSGIYSNPTSTGKAWERLTSVEYFDPNNSQQFQIDAGLRVHGGSSRNPTTTPQHSLRLHFRSEYGSPKLNFPLFDDTEVTSFDTLVLDANSSDNWTSANTATGSVAQFIRNQWAKDSQRDAGNEVVHGKFVHLYINGLYWGLYDLLERVDDGFAAEHFGGTKDDYDVIRDETAHSGDLTAWNTMLSRVRAGDYDGTLELLDVDNFIDYMAIEMFTGNWDWPDHNWDAIRKREVGGKFQFFIWDAEVGLGLDVNVPGPIVSQVLNVDLTGPRADVGAAALANGPGEIYNLLKTNPEFQLRFADRLQQLMFNNGALTPNESAARYQNRVDEIQLALIAESARWGDVRREPPSTPDGLWLTEKDWIMNTFFPNRTAIVLGQFTNQSLYPNISAPEFFIDDIAQHGGNVPTDSELTMQSVNSLIYYTSDGTDPRNPIDNQPLPTLLPYDGSPIILNASVELKARSFDGTDWSALSQATFAVDSPLRVTEIMYNQPGSDDTEFIEIQNTSLVTTINLEGVHFSEGIDFTFGNVDLGPEQFIVVTRNQVVFENVYGTNVNLAGQFVSSALSNGGETITLRDAAGAVIQSFTYDDSFRKETDGFGFSLIVLDTEAVYDVASNWRSSALASDFGNGVVGGSPGVADPDPLNSDFNGDGEVTSVDLAILLQNYGTSTAAHRATGDTDNNGSVNLLDLLQVKKSFGQMISSSPPAAAAAALITSFDSSGTRITSSNNEPLSTNKAAVDHRLTLQIDQTNTRTQTKGDRNVPAVRRASSTRMSSAVDQVHAALVSTSGVSNPNSSMRTNLLHRVHRGHRTFKMSTTIAEKNNKH